MSTNAGWVQLSPDDKHTYPTPGMLVLCKIQHWYTKRIQEVDLVHVEEGDCSWRTADDLSELSFDYNVIAWSRKKPE